MKALSRIPAVRPTLKVAPTAKVCNAATIAAFEDEAEGRLGAVSDHQSVFIAIGHAAHPPRPVLDRDLVPCGPMCCNALGPNVAGNLSAVKEVPNPTDYDRPFADCASDPFDRSRAYIANREDPRVRSCKGRMRSRVFPGHDKAVGLQGHVPRQPVRIGCGANHDENGLCVQAPVLPLEFVVDRDPL